MSVNGKILEKSEGKMIIQVNEDEKVCHTCAIRAFCKQNECETMTVPDEKKLSVGDNVEIQERKNILLKTSLLSYGIPLLFFVGGIFLGTVFHFKTERPEIYWFGFGLIGLLLGGYLGSLIAMSLSKHLRSHLIIKRIDKKSA